MSDSGFSGLPPGPPRTGESAYPQSMAERKAEIIALRGEIKAASTRRKMEGEIVRHEPDGTSRIRTDKGEITVAFRGRNFPPEGTKVEIEIPAQRPDGAPPRQILIRPAPEPLPQTSPQPDRPSTVVPDARQPPFFSPPPRPVLDAAASENLARQAPAPLSAEQSRAEPSLRPGDLLRLIPVFPDDIAAPQQTHILKISLPPRLLQSALFLPAPDEPAALPGALSSPRTFPQAEQKRLSETLPAPLFVAGRPAAPQTQAQQALSGADTDTLPQFRPSAASNSSIPAIGSFFPTQRVFFPQTLTPAFFSPAPAASEDLVISNPVLPRPEFSLFQPEESFTARIQAVAPPAVFFTAPQEQRQMQIAAAITKQTQGETLSKEAAVSGRHFSAIPPHHAGAITGEITGVTTRNLPVISFYSPAFETIQNFALLFPADGLPAGTQIRIVPQQSPLPLAAAAAAHEIPFLPAAFFSAFPWPAMDDLYKALQQVAPQTAQAFANTIMNAAAAPARIPAAALFFLAAVRSGDIGSWLGDKTADTLRRIGKGDLISRLARDFSGLQRAAAESAGSGSGAQDWRTAAFPMMGDDGLYKMMLHYRHEHGKDEEGKEEKRGVRFIFDLNLNRMGAVQLDGLYRISKDRKNRLDLIVRTKTPLSLPMQETMRGAYINALSQTDLFGDLSFQNRPDQFIRIKPGSAGSVTA